MSEELIGAAALTSRYVVAFVFLSAAIPKLADRQEFERAVRNYSLVPDRIVRTIAAWLPRVELTCAVALMLGVAVRLFAGVAAVLLLTFAAAISANLVRGRIIECGCQGSVASRRIGWGLVAGNVALAVMATAGAVFASETLSVLSDADSTLPASDGIAYLIVASALVASWLAITSARELISVARRIEPWSRR
jgi:hypothetical protein